MATATVGRELTDVFPPKAAIIGKVVLEATDFATRGTVPLSFMQHRGEVLGIADLVGAGRPELAEALAGLRPHTGRINRNGQPLTIRIPRDAACAGIAHLTEDRKEGASCSTSR